MSKPLQVPASPFDQYVMSKFLQIRPQVLGRRPVQRQYRARVYHMNSPLPVVTVNNIVYVTQSNSAATPTIFSSVQYGQPSEYGPAFSRWTLTETILSVTDPRTEGQKMIGIPAKL
ncbi:hypothetical protein cypCar_00041313 [Cyprinus carpio]|nr:hypothetical protein cypCar_00041313 [Cyprinus carpio]